MQSAQDAKAPKFVYVFGDMDGKHVESFGYNLIAKWVGMNDDVWVYVYPFSENVINDIKGMKYLTTSTLYFGMSASALGYKKNTDEGVAR